MSEGGRAVHGMRRQEHVDVVNCVWLSLSSLFFLIPIVVFLRNHKPVQNSLFSTNVMRVDYESVLAFILCCNIIVSILCWIHPVKYSIRHLCDLALARISYVLFTIYVLFIKPFSLKMRAFALLVCLSVSFLYAVSSLYDGFSQKGWCSSMPRVIVHSVFHLVASLGCSLAFVPDNYSLF